MTSFETSLGSDAFSIAAKSRPGLSRSTYIIYVGAAAYTLTASGYRRRLTTVPTCSRCLHVRRFVSNLTIRCIKAVFALSLSRSSVDFQLIVRSKHVSECFSAELTYTAPAW